MKRFLGRSKKSDTSSSSHDQQQLQQQQQQIPTIIEEADFITPVGTTYSNESHDSITNFKFDSTPDKTSGTYDTQLNLNPSILGIPTSSIDIPQQQQQPHQQQVPIASSSSHTAPSVSSAFQSTIHDASLFSSSKRTYSTNQSSYASGSSSGATKKEFALGGRPLQILSIMEEQQEDRNAEEIINDKLKQLYEDLAFIMSQFNHSLI